MSEEQQRWGAKTVEGSGRVEAFRYQVLLVGGLIKSVIENTIMY